MIHPQIDRTPLPPGNLMSTLSYAGAINQTHHHPTTFTPVLRRQHPTISCTRDRCFES
ncbi:hypothetical protein HanXRQr2_Chr17g0825001 [Helianthus annuus]|uniref:Uncharacterized protein n=1 Tax=Helianthus annuus TaxID=4232 RepID=A0A9K3GVG1_HELAN|nr:hypothetical protein HanXRQr2_Chr17g0825001 [Helianthus annuus]KAJ0814977.1 hypothetical protein HanPSC8_Chr17g0792031 [Helianthus annuus]